ncbi:hypothetical protein QR680_015841 [Steinernema hermaphroditum]|uniref:Lipase domain-containing protein n=1 Tax=Steinernema hermaphroditum TaxID=289476 RepID=A0AA39HA34_9BILA|nr:hypothetical protein QR680_015841 [Steinernema hermaphroditum]
MLAGMSRVFGIFAVLVVTLGHDLAAVPLGPITSDFRSWLQRNGYAHYRFDRTEFGQLGSYGGRTKRFEEIEKTPVIFTHGNSDGALDNGDAYGTGWSKSIAFFTKHGYHSSELYATTWGDRNVRNALTRTHSCEDMIYLRKFIEAVLKYTGAKKVNVVAHSMGVTLARPIIKGLTVWDHNGKACHLGGPINHRISNFIAISGANYGLCACADERMANIGTCDKKTGFWPGRSCGGGGKCGTHRGPICDLIDYSSVLQRANDDDTKEADTTFALWSTKDEILLNGNFVYGRHTSEFPALDNRMIFHNLTHMQTKDETVNVQLKWIQGNRLF